LTFAELAATNRQELTYDRLNHPAPTPEMLEQAVQQQASNGVAATANQDALAQPLPP
jgi:hypothetical protein